MSGLRSLAKGLLGIHDLFDFSTTIDSADSADPQPFLFFLKEFLTLIAKVIFRDF